MDAQIDQIEIAIVVIQFVFLACLAGLIATFIADYIVAPMIEWLQKIKLISEENDE